MNHDYLDRGRWTPQTQMFRALAEFIHHWEGPVREALSIDVNAEIDGMAQDRWPDLALIRAVHPAMDCQALPMEDASFDLTYSNQVLEHVPRPWLAASEILRVTRPGGLGIHTSCAFNPRHGPPAFEDYYRFLPAGLAALFQGAEILDLGEWGSRESLRHSLSTDDGYGALGGRRFDAWTGSRSDGRYPWVVWIIFQKKA